MSIFRSLPASFVSRLQLVLMQVSDNKGARLIARMRKRGYTFLDINALVDLYDRVSEIEAAQVPGVLIEAGTAMGGSAVVMAAAKRKRRALKLYDTFEMIPPPGGGDGSDAHERYATIAGGAAQGPRGQNYYGYEQDLLASVRRLFAESGLPVEENRVELIPGLYEDTLHVKRRVALAHIDCDWYDSVMVCLERITPRLVSGSVLIIDDYDHWSGCRKAVDEFFASRMDEYVFEPRSRLHIRKL